MLEENYGASLSLFNICVRELGESWVHINFLGLELIYKWYIHLVLWGEREESFYVDAWGNIVQRQDVKSKWIGDEKSNVQNSASPEVGKWQSKKSNVQSWGSGTSRNPMYRVVHCLTRNAFCMKSIKFEYILKHGFKLSNHLMCV